MTAVTDKNVIHIYLWENVAAIKNREDKIRKQFRFRCKGTESPQSCKIDVVISIFKSNLCIIGTVTAKMFYSYSTADIL